MMRKGDMVTRLLFISSIFRLFLVHLCEMILTRNFLFDNLLPLHTLYYVDTFGNISRTECAVQCKLQGSQCRAFLYNGHLLSCKLLKCHLIERIVDRDRIDDGWEYWFQNDVCSVGWVPFENHCYFFNETFLNWNEAKVQCENHGTHLIEIDSHVENTWAMKTFLPPWNAVDCSKRSDCCKCWIGATDMEIEGVFTWNHLTNITYSNWYPGQPDNVNMGHCVRFCRSGNWEDAQCAKKNTFICEDL